MRLKIEGEENYAPEVFARAEQLVWHYGLFSVLNDRSIALRARWFEEQGDESARILVLAGRSLFYNRHTCGDTCDGLPMSPWDVSSRGSYMCQHCDRPFDPISTRYLCPYDDCKMKNTCCE